MPSGATSNRKQIPKHTLLNFPSATFLTLSLSVPGIIYQINCTQVLGLGSAFMGIEPKTVGSSTRRRAMRKGIYN